MKKQILIILVIVLTINVFSQEKHSEIKGVVLDLIKNKPIKNAKISIYQYKVDYSDKDEPVLNSKTKSKLLTTTSTNSDGHFFAKVNLRAEIDYFHLIVESSNTETLHKNHIKIEQNKSIKFTLLLTPLSPDKEQESIIEKKSQNEYEKKEKEKMIDYTKSNNDKKKVNPVKDTSLFSSYRSSSSCTYSSIPTNVYVSNLHNGYNGTTSGSGYTGYINFDDYVAGVVQGEIGGITSNIETKKAQAVAARTFSMNRHLSGLSVNIGQAYNDSPNSTSQISSNITNEQIILYNGNVIDAKYSARCNGDYTQNANEGTWAPHSNCNTSGNYIPYLISRPCSGHNNCSQYSETPCCNVTISTSGTSGYIYGHGVGMCQRGIEQWGEIYDLDYCEMLNKYYTNICIANSNCDSTSDELDCSNSISLNCGVTYQGSNSTANSNVNSYGCNDWTETGPERVHTITPTSSGILTATLSNFTGDLDVYILGSCDPSDCLGTVSPFSATYSNAQAGHTYYIVVDSDNGSGSSYDLIIDCPTSNGNLVYNDQLVKDGTGGGVGNDNGQAEPGEEIDLEIQLYNSGNDDAHNVEGVLSTSDPDITITDDDRNWGDIDAGTYDWTSDFDFTVSNTCPDKDVTFTLELTSDEGNWTETFTVHIYGASNNVNLVYNDQLIKDGTGGGVGNDNGQAEPGEEIDLEIQLYNSGNDDAHNVEGVLSTSDPDITITDDDRNWGDIDAGTYDWTSDFDFTVSNTCPDKDVTFTLELTSDEGNWTETFIVHINGILSIEDFNFKNSLKLYPNPTTNIINFDTNEYTINYVEIYDVNSKFLLRFDKLRFNSIDLSNLSKGIYFIRLVNTENKKAVFRIVKE